MKHKIHINFTVKKIMHHKEANLESLENRSFLNKSLTTKNNVIYFHKMKFTIHSCAFLSDQRDKKRTIMGQL